MTTTELARCALEQAGVPAATDRQVEMVVAAVARQLAS
jgi:hypothetical protein